MIMYSFKLLLHQNAPFKSKNYPPSIRSLDRLPALPPYLTRFPQKMKFLATALLLAVSKIMRPVFQLQLLEKPFRPTAFKYRLLQFSEIRPNLRFSVSFPL